MHLDKLSLYSRRAMDSIKESKSIIIVIISCIIVSDLREYPSLLDIIISPLDTVDIVLDNSYYPGRSIVNLLGSLTRFFVYPINLLLFQKEFTDANIDQVFIMLVPLFLLFSIGLLIIISTED